ncbi:hypothetical protein CXA05_09535 [Salmonella enterica subsp. enterica serovar Typhimurium]|nr:hypothetical protein [Salmonella enterica subsp. enterica serovar Typhimurium]
MHERLHRHPRVTRSLTRDDALRLLDEVICRRMEERQPSGSLSRWLSGPGNGCSRSPEATGRLAWLKDHLAHVVTTLGGLYQYPFSASWDALLCRLLNEGMIAGSNVYTVTFVLNGQDMTVWRAGRWYASGTLFAVNGIPLSDRQKWRPRFATLRRLHAVAERCAHQQGSGIQTGAPERMMSDSGR